MRDDNTRQSALFCDLRGHLTMEACKVTVDTVHHAVGAVRRPQQIEHIDLVQPAAADTDEARNPATLPCAAPGSRMLVADAAQLPPSGVSPGASVHTPFGHRWFKTVPLSGVEPLSRFATAFTVLIAVEAEKALVRHGLLGWAGSQ